MQVTPRLYERMLSEHLNSHRQMAFLSGPRQIGKTTVSQHLASHYLDWDNLQHREILLKGPEAVADHCLLNELQQKTLVIAFDEILFLSRVITPPGFLWK